MGEIIHFFQGEMERPAMFSWFHIIFLILIPSIAFLISFFFRNAEEKVYKRILLFSWIGLLILEVMKQLIKSFHYGSPSYWEYDFYDLPFHLCSMVYFAIPILVFVDREKCPHLVDAAIGLMAFFVFLAGLAVLIYDDMVMSTLVFTNIQTLIHHGTQVILGIFVFVWNRKRVTIFTFLKSMIAFTVLASLAILINVLLDPIAPNGIDMFFLNPLEITTLPIVNVVQKEAGFFVYLLGYLTVLFAAAFLVYFVETGFYKLSLKKKAAA